jgi:hypothetical protein
MNPGGSMPTGEMNQEASMPSGTETPQAATPVEGRRTQLKIVRENVESLSRDVGNFRRSHEASIKKLEKQVSVLRKELAAQSVSKDLGSFRKNHDAVNKKLERQVATMRSEIAALKSYIARDAARGRAKQEAMMSKILAKVSPKPRRPKPTKSRKK